MSDRSSLTEARFLDAGDRRLFMLDIQPTGPCRGAVLYVPPFAEEMNRLRSHAVQQARRLAAQGWRCLLPDLTGTGESDGELAAVDWSVWVDDVRRAGRWLTRESPGPLVLWGMRTGALLAAEVLRGDDALPASRLLLWQPVLDGKLFLTQFLRLRIASQVVSDTERETTEQIRARLSAGEVVEVAGYSLSGGLADGLAARRLADLRPPSACRVLWVEVVAQPDQPLPPVSTRLIDGWRATGLQVASTGVACPMVWQVHRRAEAPELLDATEKLLQEAA
jgi:exosortase A-associated hydrolase 2